MPQSVMAMISILCGVYSGPEYTTCSRSFNQCTHGKIGDRQHASDKEWEKALNDCINDQDRQGWKKKPKHK